MQKDLFSVFARIGFYSFGGPAAQIALMHRILVEERKWLTENQFLNALSFCMLLPGPEAMQLATYAGWRLNGTRGGLLAGALFVLPGAAIMALLATVYVLYGNLPLVEAIFLGVQATVVAIVLEALLKISRKALKRPSHWVLAAISFLAIFAVQLPFPVIVLGAAIWGFLSAKAATTKAAVETPKHNTARTAVIWLAVWFAPVAIVGLFNAQLLTEIALFFSKIAVVTFGGAYAVLAYMAQTVVADFGWISTEQMMDGLGLAETTPGPLILVTEFVGFLAGYAEGGLPLAYLAALLTIWVTFAPCFLWIFIGAPFVDHLIHMPRISAALAAITAAVVGVILNLSIWFAVHVFFDTVGSLQFGFIEVVRPELASANPAAIAIAIVATFVLLVLRQGIGRTLAVGALAGALNSMFVNLNAI